MRELEKAENQTGDLIWGVLLFLPPIRAVWELLSPLKQCFIVYTIGAKWPKWPDAAMKSGRYKIRRGLLFRETNLLHTSPALLLLLSVRVLYLMLLGWGEKNFRSEFKEIKQPLSDLRVWPHCEFRPFPVFISLNSNRIYLYKMASEAITKCLYVDIKWW